MKKFLIAGIVLIAVNACEQRFDVKQNEVPVNESKVEGRASSKNDSIHMNHDLKKEKMNEIYDQARLIKKTNEGLGN